MVEASSTTSTVRASRRAAGGVVPRQIQGERLGGDAGGSAEDVDRAVTGELDLTQSLLVAWPQITALAALIVVLFTAAYLLFMRQEIRA